MTIIDQINNYIKYPLTHPQKRIWYIEKIYPNTSLHNIGGPVRIKGPVNFKALEEAIHIFIKRHEGLRLRVSEQNGEAYQYVSEYTRHNLDFYDFSPYDNPQDEYNCWIKQEASKPFVLENERLFYFALFKISDQDNGYLAKFHHIICDGWSTSIMTEQICDVYIKLCKEEAIVENNEQSYLELIHDEKKYLWSDRFLKNKLFWHQKFKILPETFFNKSSDIIEGKRKTYLLDREVSLRIKEFAKENQYSLNTFFVSLYLIYANKVTQQEDLVIGTPVLNRSGKKQKSIFGMFTSTMPFGFFIDNSSTVVNTMAKVNTDLMECYHNQKYPYDLLVQDLELQKNGVDNLFNVCVNYYNTKLNSELNGLPIENVEFYNGNQIYSLQLVIKDWADSGRLTLDFDYKINDYSDEQIDTMYLQLTNLMNFIILNPYKEVKKISLLTDHEREQLLYGFNVTEAEYPKDKTIIQLFEAQAEKTPDKVAISFNQTELTYKELNAKANQLARYLVSKGVTEETIVGLLTTHSIETVIGILGILKAGGAYLPIDPNYPDDRISYMLEDSSSQMLLANLKLPDGINFNGEYLNLNDQSPYLNETSNPEVITKPDDLVYIIYTSGSTGKPKGTMIEHRGLVNYICWAKKMYVKADDEVFPLYSSLSFDLTVTSIFVPLISGNKIIVYSSNKDEDEYVLYRIIKENKATVIKLTPSHLSLLQDRDNRNLSVRRFIVGGEDFKVSLARNIHENFDGNIEIFNEYGPTETVVGCMIYKYDYESDTRISVPIGVPADNVQIYLLDKNLNPVPLNIVGELYVSGDGVGRGYLNRVKLTQEKFMANPFISGKRMYKTGDLARFIGNGTIEYVGRADQQVKISGCRIELGEIENYIQLHEAIKDVVVIDFEDRNKNKYLCSYIVKKAEIATSVLKDFLLRYLPDYMVPAHFIEMEEIPLTPNGKVNRELLSKPEIQMIENAEIITYRNEKEEQLVNTICEVLKIEALHLRQNFYQLGGDSIKAIQIASKLNEKGLKIKVKEILSHPIIKEMALCIQNSKGLEINQDTCEGNIQPTPIVSWFLARNFANPHHYNQSVLVKLKQDIETSKLEIILNELIKHHDSLRINYNSQTGELFYNNEHLSNNYQVREYDLTNLSFSGQVDRMTSIADDLKSSFNIETDILIKACVFSVAINRKLILITAHHLVVDGVSWRIIVDDINTMIKQINSRQGIRLPVKTHSYQEWAKTLDSYGKKQIDQEVFYWDFVLKQDFSFPIDYDLGLDTLDNSHTISFQISEVETELLVTSANTAYNTETKELLITALLRTIKWLTGKEDIIIELEGHGREDIGGGLDISRTVGWFTNLYPFYIKLKSDQLSDQIKKVKEEIRKIPNKGIGFGILKYLSKVLNDERQSYIRFNFLGEFTSESDNHSLQLLSEQLGGDSSKANSLTCFIDINCLIVSGKLNVLLTYSRKKFYENTMVKLLNSYINNLKTIINYCVEKHSVEVTPSDFDTVALSFEELESIFK
jgi:amino acid adenylation domain-containing protein/non-ribosomal peptide synthase protein (TIGR01720 family)